MRKIFYLEKETVIQNAKKLIKKECKDFFECPQGWLQGLILKSNGELWLTEYISQNTSWDDDKDEYTICMLDPIDPYAWESTRKKEWCEDNDDPISGKSDDNIFCWNGEVYEGMTFEAWFSCYEEELWEGWLKGIIEERLGSDYIIFKTKHISAHFTIPELLLKQFDKIAGELDFSRSKLLKRLIARFIEKKKTNKK